MRRRRRTRWRCPRCQTPAARREARNKHRRDMYHKYYKASRVKQSPFGCLVSSIEMIVLVLFIYCALFLTL